MRSELLVPEEESKELQPTSLHQGLVADENVSAQSSPEKEEAATIGLNPDPEKVQGIEDPIICGDIMNGRTIIETQRITHWGMLSEGMHDAGLVFLQEDKYGETSIKLIGPDKLAEQTLTLPRRMSW